MIEPWRETLRAVHGVESKYKRLVKAIASDIESQTLPADARLPPQRDVAAELAISVQTVTNAYKELERQGLIRCEVGRGSFVAARVTEAMSSYMLDTAERSVVDFSIARIIHTAEHDAMWRKVCATLSTIDDQPWIRAFRPIAGFEHHRQAGVAWLASLGMPASADTLLVTNGAAHGIFLALDRGRHRRAAGRNTARAAWQASGAVAEDAGQVCARRASAGALRMAARA